MSPERPSPQDSGRGLGGGNRGAAEGPAKEDESDARSESDREVPGEQGDDADRRRDQAIVEALEPGCE